MTDRDRVGMSANLKSLPSRTENPIITVTEMGMEWQLDLKATFPNGVKWSDYERVAKYLPFLALRAWFHRWKLWRRYQIFLRACTIKLGKEQG